MKSDHNTKPLGIGLALAVLAGWCYLPTLSHGFVNFDDDIYVTKTRICRQV